MFNQKTKLVDKSDGCNDFSAVNKNTDVFN